MFADGMGYGGFGGGGGGGGSWGDGSGQYTPSVNDGMLSATRNTGVPGPTDKPQANAAGVPDTGGQAAANAPDKSQLRKTIIALQQQLISLQNQRDALTTTADPVDNAINNIDDALTNAYNSALGDLPDYEKMKEDAKSLYDLKADLITDRQDQLEERYQEDKAATEADFATQKDELKESQGSQTGRLASGLANAGAYLGFDNVNHSAMLSLQVTHDREMTTLGQAKIAALSEARRAFEDADFALLSEHVNAIEAYDKKITELANTNFTQTLQLTQEARNNVKFMQDTETFERNKAFTNLDTIIESGKMPTENDIQKYAQTTGQSVDVIRGFITNKQNTKTLADKRAKTADDIAIVNALSKIDKGQYVTLGGTTYEGMNVPTVTKTSSNSPLTYEDVFKDFNNSPIARQLVGQTKDSVYQMLGSDTPPEELGGIDGPIAQGIPDLSANPDDAAVQVQMAWENMSNDALNLGTSRELERFDYDDQNLILQEINDQREETARITGNTDWVRIELDDLKDPNVYTHATLNDYRASAIDRANSEEGGSLLGDIESAFSNQGTLGTLNQ
jgi:hypothetical protein